MKGIFYNSQKAVCSIWESGRMVYEALSKSSAYTLDYSEERHITHGYDFYVFNQHISVNNWMTPELIIDEIKKPCFCVVTEVRHSGNPIADIPDYYSKYIVLDPTIKETDTIFAFPRPLEHAELSVYEDKEYPVVGSFGLDTPGKDWGGIITAVQKEYDEALVRINVPIATHVPTYMQNFMAIVLACKRQVTKPGIKFNVTSEYMEKPALIKWCSENTINVFLYNRTATHPTGLAAVTDQAISSLRPLLVSSDPTFRHILQYIKPYPEMSLREAIAEDGNAVAVMNDVWSAKNFYTKFEHILL